MMPDAPEPRRAAARERLREAVRRSGAAVRAHPRIVLGALAAIAALAAALGTLAYWLSPPPAFPVNDFVELPEDAAGPALADALAAQGVVRSPRLFLALARLTGQDTALKSGRYVFAEPIGTRAVLGRVAAGAFGIEPVRVTLTEGMTVRDMADELERALPGFDRAAFLEAASTSEGYLFPETYFFMPGDAEEDIVVRLRAQFSAEIAEITDEILAFGRPFPDVVVMASLLEREAQTLEDKRVIAGILWRRLEIDMPLQVDAVFAYILGVQSHHPSFADLELDSPYNTYRNRGLPPGPIANPGLRALTAAVTPVESEYLYYLTGVDGQMYYARTFEEHLENRRRYLDIEEGE